MTSSIMRTEYSGTADAILPIREIDLWRRLSIQRGLVDVPHDTLDRERIGSVSPEMETTTDRALAGELAAREALVDEHRTPRGCAVVFVEVASRSHWNFHRAEIAGADLRHLDTSCRPGRGLGTAGDPIVAGRPRSVGRHRGRNSSRLHARHSAQPLEHRKVESC